MKNDLRYPYTYSADYIRSLAGYNSKGTILFRHNAAQIADGIAEALNMDSTELKTKLADFYLKHEEEITEKSAKGFLVIMETLNAN